MDEFFSNENFSAVFITTFVFWSHFWLHVKKWLLVIMILSKEFIEVPKSLESYWNINKQELKCSETLPCRSPLSIYRWACGFFNMSSQLGLLYLIVWSGFDVVRSFSHPLNTVWSLLICRLGKYLKVGNYRFMSNKITSWVIFFVSSHSYWF